MKRNKILGTTVLLAAVLVVSASAEEAKEGVKAPAKAPAAHYLGVAKCKTCHNTAKSGMQYTKWTESKHSKAFALLATPEALEIAKKKGIADPQKSADCLKCHVTGYGEPTENFEATFKPEDGVQCETCHGAGSNYFKMATMKAVRAGTTDRDKVGLLIPTKKTCDKCHNAEGTGGKEVDWSADSTKIAHPIPKAAG